jgi:hypothetical protein
MEEAVIIEELEQEEPMFVQVAGGMSASATELTLTDLAPSTLFFSDRPQRIVGHLHAQQFVDLWGKGDNSFAEDPPNAVLSFVTAGDERPEDAVIVIKDPRLDGSEITYKIDILEGELPSSAGPVTLFIDPFGRPLSPVSVAGVRRRDRRRDRRR